VQIEIHVGPYAIPFLLAVLGIVVAILIERYVGWYFKKCIRLGMDEYQGRKIREYTPNQSERWQRVYMYYLQRPIRLGLIQQIPYYVVTIIVLVVIFVPMALADPTAIIVPIWILFPVWIVTLTCATYCRAATKSREYREKT
jgi:hypothetical protein